MDCLTHKTETPSPHVELHRGRKEKSFVRCIGYVCIPMLKNNKTYDTYRNGQLTRTCTHPTDL